MSVIQTRSGYEVDLLNINPDTITIEDIAWGLSMTCRFGGQTSKFYSVAEHCLLVASLLPRADRWDGLMHDASEAFIGDIPGPLKPLLDSYLVIEKDLTAVINSKFNVYLNSRVKEADKDALAIEASILMTESSYWDGVYEEDNVPTTNLECMSPDVAFDRFMKGVSLFAPR